MSPSVICEYSWEETLENIFIHIKTHVPDHAHVFVSPHFFKYNNVKDNQILLIDFKEEVKLEYGLKRVRPGYITVELEKVHECIWNSLSPIGTSDKKEIHLRREASILTGERYLQEIEQEKQSHLEQARTFANNNLLRMHEQKVIDIEHERAACRVVALESLGEPVVREPVPSEPPCKDEGPRRKGGVIKIMMTERMNLRQPVRDQ